MKSVWLYSICTFFIAGAFAQEVIFSSNLTRHDLENYHRREISCQTDKDCPSYAFCNLQQNFCTFMDFLCPEDPNQPCHYQSDILKFSYDDHFTPILAACTKEQVDRHQCHTKKCTASQDCWSGQCYAGSCVSDTTLYQCSYDHYNDNFDCRKRDHMKCTKEEECRSYICKGGYCLRYYNSPLSTIKNFLESIFWEFMYVILTIFVFNILVRILGRFRKSKESEITKVIIKK